MKIRDIQIDGFGVWSGLAVDAMPDGMTVFYGPNEAGKTTLMNFLRTMFYGFTAERRQRYLPPVHGGKPGGAIRVTGPGGGYEIARRATLNDPSVHGQLTVTSNDGITQGQHRLTSLLGNVDESIFTNVFAIGLRELQELSTLDDTSAADELYKLSSGLDRVSLVDVIRQLRTARGQLIANGSEGSQLPSMLSRREKLRDEIEQLTLRGRRWGELAVHRRNQQNEIDELKLRVQQWELEAKSIEIALQVREPWFERETQRTRLATLHARTDLPDEAAKSLRELQEQIDDKKRQIQTLLDQRRAVRKRAHDLPISKNILALAGKIEAASEQGPWITQIQKQIQRLESELRQTQEQLVEDAKRLGLSEPDQQALLNEKRLASLPDLSRGAITQLAGPARDVRTHQLRLKQARERSENDRREADSLRTEIADFLETRRSDDLQAAIRNASDRIQTLRKYQQIEERLDKLAKHRQELEGETVELESDDGFSWERVAMLAIPFFFGSFMLISGLNHFFGWYNSYNLPAAARLLQGPSSDSQNTGVLMTVLGLCILVGTYLWWKSMERGMQGDIHDCESQLEALMLQVRKTEQERNELQQALPEHSGSIDQQLRDAEHELSLCESLLPVFHNEQAARQRLQSAKRQGIEALNGLKTARGQWQKTLQQLGLAESLSPKSIRILAEGYESLSQTRKRFKAQSDELSQRRIELTSALQKLDALSTQLKVALAESRTQEPIKGNARELASAASMQDPSIAGPQQKLQELVNTLAQHQQYIAQRRELRNEDEELAKKQKGTRRLMDRAIRARQALLADLGVESPQQLDEHLARKQEHLRIEKDIVALNERVRSIIGAHVPYESIAKILENTPANELEKRWDTLGSRVTGAEDRIGQLLQRLGETSQEMKTLAADRRLSEAKLELSCLERQIEMCTDHWRTLGATTCMLEKVCDVYENERQPETLREASSFLKQLTDGKYVRVWTPLGKNALRIDNERGQSLPLEVLSRGTREAVFIALRLSLAAAYSRRGVALPLVLDDVLVNFDSLRATSAAKVLRDFAALGHQVVMFTCHEHIMKMFHGIGVQVRVLPAQGQSGEATIYYPEVDVQPAAIAVPSAPLPLPEPPPEPASLPISQPAAIEPQPVTHIHPLVLIDPPDDAPDILTLQPRRPTAPAKRAKAVPVTSEEGMWFERELEPAIEPTPDESTLRLWTEWDAPSMPLEGEPQDAWWEANEGADSWVEPSST